MKKFKIDNFYLGVILLAILIFSGMRCKTSSPQIVYLQKDSSRVTVHEVKVPYIVESKSVEYLDTTKCPPNFSNHDTTIYVNKIFYVKGKTDTFLYKGHDTAFYIQNTEYIKTLSAQNKTLFDKNDSQAKEIKRLLYLILIILSLTVISYLGTKINLSRVFTR